MADFHGKRVPGPLGLYPDFGGGRTPGPRGTVLWDKKTTVTPDLAPAKAAVATKMPGPTKDEDSRDLHAVPLPLFAAKGSPGYKEVKQAPGLANCPVAAILAALAYTASGQSTITGLLSEASGAVTTDVSDAGTLANPPAGRLIKSSRSFTVNLPGGAVVVSDVLYTDDHDRGWSPFYMRDPADRCMWQAIIEKGLAAQLGSYENIDALNISANGFWEKIVGSKPNGFTVEDIDEKKLSGDAEKKHEGRIKDAAKAAARVPTIAASRDTAVISKITQFHGYAVLGEQNGTLSLYDPAAGKTVSVTVKEFRGAFSTILFK